MKRLLPLPLLLVLASCGETPAENHAKAQAEFAAHDYVAAKLHLAQALAETPGDKAMLLLQAKTLIALGDGDGAGAALAKLSAAAPTSLEIAELSAEAALLRKAPDAALKLLDGFDSVEAERLRALAALAKQDLPGAEEHFAKGKAQGGDARLLADYARLRLLKGDLAGAGQLAQEADKLSADAIDSLLINGQILLRKGDLAGALTRYERAHKSYPASLAAMTGMAGILGDLGRQDEMDKVLAKAAAFAPNDAGVAFLQVRSAAARKDWAAVRALIQPRESLIGQIDPLRQIYAEALLRMGQSELAVAQLQPIVRALPGNREAVTLLAEAQYAAKDLAGAAATLRSLADRPDARPAELALMANIAKSAGDPAAASYEARARQPAAQALGQDFIDGDAAMRAGNWAGAAQAYQRLLAGSDGRNPVVLNNMAYAQLMLGNMGPARQFADKAMAVAPANASVLDTAGWVRVRSAKDLGEAVRILEKAAQLAPGNQTIAAHLAEAKRAAK